VRLMGSGRLALLAGEISLGITIIKVWVKSFYSS
jgi:hypothetical protein